MDDDKALEIGRAVLAQQAEDAKSVLAVRAELHRAVDDLDDERVLRFAGRYTGNVVGAPKDPHDGLLDWLTRHTEA